MSATSYSDTFLRGILERTRTLAMVGASAKPERPSHHVMLGLQRLGYRVIPVNPGLAGQTLNGERVYASLHAIPQRVDMVDVFRTSSALAGIVEDTIAIGAPVLWTQLGVRDDAAAARAEAAGIEVVMDRCPMIEAPRLGLGPR